MAKKEETASGAGEKKEEKGTEKGVLGTAKVEPRPEKSQKEKLADWRERHGYRR